MSTTKTEPPVSFFAPFFTTLCGVLLFEAVLPAAEVYLAAASWHAVACGAFLGLGLGLRGADSYPRFSRGMIWAVLVIALTGVLPWIYEWIARIAPKQVSFLFIITALPPLAIFFAAGRLLPPMETARRGATVTAASGALAGALFAFVAHLLLLEGRVYSLEIAGAVSIAALSATGMRSSRIRRAGIPPASAEAAAPRRPVAVRLGAFFAGAALAGAYPVARKVLLQLASSTAATDTLILGTALTGALLGALLLWIFFSSPGARSGVGLLGMVALAGGIYFLSRELAFTQDMRGFADFKRYVAHLYENYFSFARAEIPLYLALLGLPSFAAGLGLCGLRGAWRWLLLGLGAGALAGTGLLPWMESSGGLALQAAICGAAAAVLFTFGALAARDGHPSRAWSLAALPAVAVMAWFVVGGMIRFESHEYRDLPIPGEVDLLLFEPTPDGDLRVTTSAEDEALVRVNADYVYFNRGRETIANLAARMPRLIGLEGNVLVAGPLAPIMAPLIEQSVVGADEGSSETRFTALETVPSLRPAVQAISDHAHGHFQTDAGEDCGHDHVHPIEDAGKGAALVAEFLLGCDERFDNVILLPVFGRFDHSRGILSHEFIGMAAETLGEKGRLWLYFDTSDTGADAVAAAAAAVAGHFEHASLWVVEDGLLPPLILCLGCREGGEPDGEAMTSAVAWEVHSKGTVAAEFRTHGELADFLLADPDGMHELRRDKRAPSARIGLPPGRFDGKPPGWAAVKGVLETVPAGSLEKACGLPAPDEDRMRAAREHVMAGLMVHRRYDYDITPDSDLDWELFAEETGHYREAFRAEPRTALGRRILNGLLPMLFEHNELQRIFELIRGISGNAPPDPEQRFALGKVSFELLDFEDALGHFRAAAEADPLFAGAKLHEGLALFFLDRKEEALQAFDETLAVDPYRTAALKYRAMALYDVGRVEEAGPACRTALEHLSDDEELQSLIMLIEEKVLPPVEKKEDDHEHHGHDH